jgi:hypothetical protein
VLVRAVTVARARLLGLDADLAHEREAQLVADPLVALREPLCFRGARRSSDRVEDERIAAGQCHRSSLAQRERQGL